MNPLQQLIQRFPNGYWNRNELSRNPNCDFAFLRRFPKFFDVDTFSENHSLRWTADVVANPNLGWNYGLMASNPAISVSFILSNLKRFTPNPDSLSRHPQLTIQTIRANPDLFWCPTRLSQNPGIRIADMVQLSSTWNFHKGPFYRKSTWDELLTFGPIPFEWVLQNHNLRWRHFTEPRYTRHMQNVIDVRDPSQMHFTLIMDVCKIPDIPEEVLHAYIKYDRNLLWTVLKHPRMTMAKIAAMDISLVYYMEVLCANPNITCEFVVEHPELPWAHCFQNLSWNRFKLDPVLRAISAEAIQRLFRAHRFRTQVNHRCSTRATRIAIQHFPGRGMEYIKACSNFVEQLL